MINRLFLILDLNNNTSVPLPKEDNVYYSILADPRIDGSMNNAYAKIGQTPGLSLTIRITTPLEQSDLLFISAFLFLPGYRQIDHRVVLNLTGEDREILAAASAAITTSLAAQGIDRPLIYLLRPYSPADSPISETSVAPTYMTALYCRSKADLDHGIRDIIDSRQFGATTLFFQNITTDASNSLPDNTSLQSAYDILQRAESSFSHEFPELYAMALRNITLDHALQEYRYKLVNTEAELESHRRILQVLRSGHQAKEIQQYYDREYESLPLWYKRFGHILKVLTGKRTFRSLFRDDVKKYKD